MKKVILKCDNLCKRYKKKIILDDINLEVYEKDIIGLIGRNGVGKTTLIKTILGLQKKDKGTVIINGYNIDTNFSNAIEKVGAIIENPDFYNYLTGKQNLYLYKNMYKDITDEQITELIKLVGLEEDINTKVSKYSLGMKQRLGIAVSLLHNPNLLILDEPTNGLDPKGINELRNILINLSKNNIAILISSHNLNEIEAICNTIYIINDAKIEKIENINNRQYVIEVNSTNNIKKFINSKIYIVDSKNFKIDVDKENIPKIIKKLINNNINVYKVIEENINLENIFLDKIGE